MVDWRKIAKAITHSTSLQWIQSTNSTIISLFYELIDFFISITWNERNWSMNKSYYNSSYSGRIAVACSWSGVKRNEMINAIAFGSYNPHATHSLQSSSNHSFLTRMNVWLNDWWNGQPREKCSECNERNGKSEHRLQQLISIRCFLSVHKINFIRSGVSAPSISFILLNFIEWLTERKHSTSFFN